MFSLHLQDKPQGNQSLVLQITLTHLCLMEFTTIINLTIHFEFKGCWVHVVIYNFIQIIKVYSVSKRWRIRPDAACCSLWFNSPLFADVQ